MVRASAMQQEGVEGPGASLGPSLGPASVNTCLQACPPEGKEEGVLWPPDPVAQPSGL